MSRSMRTSPLLALAFAACGSAAQPTTIDLAAPVPTDPRLHEGALANGARFEILPLAGAKIARVWLVVRAGSLEEDDDQRGLAHLVEHCAFMGTTHFPGHAIVDFTERAGMDFGADLNAVTAYDSTTYKLAIPLDQKDALTTGLDVLRDWASDVSFEPAAIDHERSVVLEERRLGEGPRGFGDLLRDFVLRGSRYALRPTIGDRDIVAHAPREALLHYYHDWYRPDLMTVIVVGDVDAAKVEAEIRTRFSSLVEPAKPRPLPAAHVQIHDGDVAFDHSLGDTAIAIVEQPPPNPRRTFRDLRAVTAARVRLRAIAIDDSARDKIPSDSTERDVFGDVVLDVERGFEDDDTVPRLERAHRGKLSARAIARARRELIAQMARYAGAPEDAGADADALAERAVHGGWYVSDDASRRYESDLIADLTDEEIALRPRGPVAAIGTFRAESGDDESWFKELEEKLRTGVVAAAKIEPPDHWQPLDIGDAPRDPVLPAMPAPPPGRIVATRRFDAQHVVEWTLSNGARVVARRTVVPGHGVSLTAISPGGASLASPGDVVMARVAAHVVEAIGGTSTPALRGPLRALGIHVGVQIDQGDTRITASASSPDRLEAMLQVIDGYVLAPARSVEYPNGGLSPLRIDLQVRSQTPELELADEAFGELVQHDPLFAPLTDERVKAVDRARALDFYRARVADMSNFTFVIVGDFDEQALASLVERYLAGLPGHGRHERADRPGFRWQAGDHEIVHHDGDPDRATVAIIGWNPSDADPRRIVDVELLRLILANRVRGVLRDERAQTYRADVHASFELPPLHGWLFEVDFACAPANAEALASSVRTVIAELRDGGIGDDDVARARAHLLHDLEGVTDDPDAWAAWLENAYAIGLDAGSVDPEPARSVVADTAKARALAREYLALGGTETSILLPAAAK
jgi:zinc protease